MKIIISQDLEYVWISFVCILQIMTFYSYLKTMLTDPGILKIPLSDEDKSSLTFYSLIKFGIK